MFWRRLCLARAWLALGLFGGLMGGLAARAEPDEPLPGTGTKTERVSILDARDAGQLQVELRGHGPDRVRIKLSNISKTRLNVVLPPGLVAASATGQAGAAGGLGGGGGAFQSMGLGAVNNQMGSFGRFADESPEPGFRSLPADEPSRYDVVAVPVGQTVELTVPAVCLNYGKPSPTPRDRFRLMDVGEYSPDPRVQKALRCLGTTGTSQGVAQAVMWHVCNGILFENMALQASKVMNLDEIALAARFVAELDAGLDPARIRQGRIFVQVLGQGRLLNSKDVARLQKSLDGLSLLGLPVQVTGPEELPAVDGPALYLAILVQGSQAGETRGQVVVRRPVAPNSWTVMGRLAWKAPATVSVLEGADLLRVLDRTLASAFVTTRTVKRDKGSTALRIENYFPFTLSGVVVKAGESGGAPRVQLDGVGVGPHRRGLVSIQADAGAVERVFLNGL